MSATEPDVYYRIRNDQNGDGTYILEVHEHQVLKRTPKGAWIESYVRPHCYKRFVPDSSRRKWAWPTIGEAEESFQRRKESQIDILERQMESAKAALDMVKQVDRTSIRRMR